MKLQVIIGFLTGFCTCVVIASQDDVTMWEEFVVMLKEGKITTEHISPRHEGLRDPILGFLGIMSDKALWDEWSVEPDIHRVEDVVHFVLPLTFNEKTDTYVFSFIETDDRWYFHHLESIFIRLDEIDAMPASEFPDIPDDKKNWIREEIHRTEQVRLFNYFAEDKGKEFAFDWFGDGKGYFLSAQSWVPFIPEHKAFVLYLCWEQANLCGNEVTLVDYSDYEATVHIKPVFLKLYEQTAHLKQTITYEDYLTLYETIWHDRAHHAGWHLEITYENGLSIFQFTRDGGV